MTVESHLSAYDVDNEALASRFRKLAEMVEQRGVTSIEIETDIDVGEPVEQTISVSYIVKDERSLIKRENIFNGANR